MSQHTASKAKEPYSTVDHGEGRGKKFKAPKKIMAPPVGELPSPSLERSANDRLRLRLSHTNEDGHTQMYI